MRRYGRQAITIRTALHETGKDGEIARLEHGTKDFPIHSVPADDQYAVRHCGRLLESFVGFPAELRKAMSSQSELKS
jgi:hypothetical protein